VHGTGAGKETVDTMSRYQSIRRWLLIILLIFLLPASAPAKSLTCSYLPGLMQDFLTSHYAMKSLDNEVKTHTVDQMVKRLDISKTLLYEADVERLRRDITDMFATMEDGSCIALQGVYSLFLARARENEQFAKKFLGPDYTLDETVELNTDLDKRPYPKTRAEKEDLLGKFIHFQIANALLAGLSLEEAKKQQIHRYELQTRRISERKPEQLVTSFAEAFAVALDPHSAYMSPENMEDFRIQMQLSLEGIGAALSNDNGFTVIEELIPGGGAERSGRLKPKDKIIAVAQEKEKPVDVIDMDLRDVIKMIRGKKGSKVTLTILRQAEQTNRFDVTIVRDRIDIKEQEAKLAYETRRLGSREYVIGVIDLPSFYGGEADDKSSYEDVKNLLVQAKAKNVDGIILNLSRNGGGLLKDAVRISGLFLGKGGVVATKDSQDEITILANGISSRQAREDKRTIISFPKAERAVLYTGPLVVLTSRVSASASEIVAGALKDYRRAVIIGADHTFGKGSVQTLAQLPLGLGGMKVTTGLYFLPGGMSTQKVGVAADIVLPGLFSLEEIGESALDYPLPAQTIAPFVYAPDKSTESYPSWRPVDASLMASLSGKSAARIAKDEKFGEIVKNANEIAGKKGLVRITDLRKESAKENGDNGKKKDDTREDLRRKAKDQEAPYVAEGVNILLDMITAARSSAVTVTSSSLP
jgi:carboxyl-terminal processing protease